MLNHRTLLELITAEARFVTAKVISKLIASEMYFVRSHYKTPKERRTPTCLLATNMFSPSQLEPPSTALRPSSWRNCVRGPP